MKANKNLQTKTAKLVKSVAEKTFTMDANSTSCMIFYQPKAPATLKKFSKIK